MKNYIQSNKLIAISHIKVYYLHTRRLHKFQIKWDETSQVIKRDEDKPHN